MQPEPQQPIHAEAVSPQGVAPSTGNDGVMDIDGPVEHQVGEPFVNDQLIQEQAAENQALKERIADLERQLILANQSRHLAEASRNDLSDDVAALRTANDEHVSDLFMVRRALGQVAQTTGHRELTIGDLPIIVRDQRIRIEEVRTFGKPIEAV